MPRAVLDGSVLVSAFLTPKGTSGEVLAAAHRGAFSFCLSREIITETAGKLLGKHKLTRYGYEADHVETFCDGLAGLARLVGDLPKGRFVPGDPKDDPIVATALAAKADYLVTGDHKHLLPLETFRGIAIVTPRRFLDAL